MKEQISALMDDEFDPDAAEHLFKALESDEALEECWATYHLIGDSMRGNAGMPADFQRRLMQRLEAEPTVLAPSRRFKPKPGHIWSAAASVAAVMFVGWVALQAQAPSSRNDVASASLAQNNVSPESVNSYLLAHHELSPESSMQTAYYVRPVAYAGNGN